MTIHDQDDVRLLKPTREIWSEAQKTLVKKMSQPSFESWIRPSQLIDYNKGIALIAVSNDFVQTMIANHYMEALAQAIGEVTQEKVTIKVVVDANAQSESYSATIASITSSQGNTSSTTITTDNRQSETGLNSNVSSFSSTSDGLADVSSRSSGPNTNHNLGGSNSNFGNGLSMVASSGAHAPGALQNGASSRLPDHVTISRSNLNPKYAFDSFVVGSHNRFSHSAAQAVAQRPGQAYNPLFIYGGVGLGKTHLMHAIGHEILKGSPNASVRYISCEKFTNELINSIRDDRMMDFRKRYRQIDVLLVDDIQFLQGKESTQEEFFHTFNALRDSGKQIVLSSDRPPKAIARLEERLRSRFEWGLISDVQAPDLETRLAILRKKCALEGMRVDDEILEYIASLFTNNIRELEGALIRSHAYANLTGETLTVNALAGMLQPTTPSRPKVTLTCDRIIDTVAAHYRVESSELRSAKRSQDLALPRHIAMYLAHDMINMSFPRIGEAFGNRKHTSALYAHSRIKELVTKDPGLSQSIKQITHQLTD
ncbi:MAG: chromosomal replication initiator protein [Cyanobacteriota bacterium erpe_2018_sw_21hr_WHONDRS-SW48-000092_B_bin.40]|jgi:chromosomal replication initiator protein|nr:chromosomal replication initiator protein [Cyanobacteriota bacterium erpe_2018_sw_21hr_WHONDRS-SW48-000092_B_bin.40]